MSINIIGDLYVCGDVHGEFNKLKAKIKAIDIKDCYLVIVGDIGIGFHPNFEKEYRFVKDLYRFLEKRNIKVFAQRGNHDDPQYFKYRSPLNFSHITLLPDYTILTINGEKCLFVGGAVSVDRIHRIPGRSYWPDEVFVLDESKIVECDVLFTHSAPTWVGPYNKATIGGWCAADPLLWDDCCKEREAHNKLIELCKAKRHYCGHFHEHSTNTVNGCTSKILDIMEIVEHR